MITFRRLTILFFVILLGLNLLNLIQGWSFSDFHGLCRIGKPTSYIYIMVLVTYMNVSVFMAFLPCSEFHHKVVCSGQTSGKVLALSFDDGPHPEYTGKVLQILRTHEVHATFFCIGNNIEGNEDLIRQIDREGHLIGNHSLSHSKWFDFFSARKIRSELLATDKRIRMITGKTPSWFRPPYGVVTPLISSALKGMHWTMICWNIRSFDTVMANPEKTIRRIMKKLKPGSIVLLHDHTGLSVHSLDNLITTIVAAGYRIIPMDQLIKKQAYV